MEAGLAQTMTYGANPNVGQYKGTSKTIKSKGPKMACKSKKPKKK